MQDYLQITTQYLMVYRKTIANKMKKLFTLIMAVAMSMGLMAQNENLDVDAITMTHSSSLSTADKVCYIVTLSQTGAQAPIIKLAIFTDRVGHFSGSYNSALANIDKSHCEFYYSEDGQTVEQYSVMDASINIDEYTDGRLGVGGYVYSNYVTYSFHLSAIPVIDEEQAALEEAKIATTIATKLIHNGLLLIMRDGVTYNAEGAIVE